MRRNAGSDGRTDNLCLSRGVLFLRCGSNTTTSWSFSRGSAYFGYALAVVAPFVVVDDEVAVTVEPPPAVEYFEYAMLLTLLLPP